MVKHEPRPVTMIKHEPRPHGLVHISVNKTGKKKEHSTLESRTFYLLSELWRYVRKRRVVFTINI